MDQSEGSDVDVHANTGEEKQFFLALITAQAPFRLHAAAPGFLYDTKSKAREQGDEEALKLFPKERGYKAHEVSLIPFDLSTDEAILTSRCDGKRYRLRLEEIS